VVVDFRNAFGGASGMSGGMNMKKWIVVGSAVAVLLIGVSVYALQSGDAIPVQVQEATSSRRADCSGCVTSSGCGSAAGGCGASVSPERNQLRLEQIKAYLVSYYTKERGLTDVTVEVESFGCHEEATVKQGGKVVERLSINGGSITKIEG
jgi:hypothetical protein